MNDHISYEANPETQGTGPVQFFESESGDTPAGTKARSRPPDKTRSRYVGNCTVARIKASKPSICRFWSLSELSK